MSDGGKKNLFFSTRLGGTKNNNPLKRTNSALDVRAKSQGDNEDDDKYNFYMYRLQDKESTKKAKAYNNFSNVRSLVEKPTNDGLNIPPEARKRMELRM